MLNLLAYIIWPINIPTIDPFVGRRVKHTPKLTNDRRKRAKLAGILGRDESNYEAKHVRYKLNN